ncbi:DUF3466 family protein [Vibrio methylphosphonaticus]|uniref:DUF3466 family protein n=1 Tax=Vibrio methylphosphonaticus TaxID=2946866 RepID=UPI00202ABC45|nr:DUF3466 family protein [Vibrio methylphosphonaticus]MCL9773796.1 DUF3466 family protein [Vibrio methylphosphonaticus]
MICISIAAQAARPSFCHDFVTPAYPYLPISQLDKYNQGRPVLKGLPLSVISLCIITSYPSHSALYRIVEVETSSYEAASEFHAASILPSDSNSCFSQQCIETDHPMIGYSMNGLEGLPLDEEVAFGVDKYFYYLDYDDLSSYCYSELGYATCDAWTSRRWYGDSSNGIGGLQNERDAYYTASYTPLYRSFDESQSTLTVEPYLPAHYSDTLSIALDTMEFKVLKKDSQGNILANASSGYFDYQGYYAQAYRHRGIVINGATVTTLLPLADDSLSFADSEGEQLLIEEMGGTLAFDTFTYPTSGSDSQTYVVGNAAVATFDYSDSSKYYAGLDLSGCVDLDQPVLNAACQNFGFSSQAFIWSLEDNGDTRFPATSWATSYDSYSYATAQASIRAAAIIDSENSVYDQLPVLVGFNTELADDNMLIQAAIFRPIDTANFVVAENAWESVFINNAKLESDDTYIYSNSLAKDINEHLLVVGEAKRSGSVPESGTAANRMFIADASQSSPTAVYFSSLSQSIFFTSAGGEVNAINNYNEIVGEVDAENHSEIDSKQRRRRGFIYPYNGTGSDVERRAVMNNRAWWLDDLTNGGEYSNSNNAYRITSASDINDAGVIAATAIKCASGYDTTDHFATCGEGTETETVVAVKLMPINGATSADIYSREEDTSTVSRAGGSAHPFAILGLLLLGLGRRRART